MANSTRSSPPLFEDGPLAWGRKEIQRGELRRLPRIRFDYARRIRGILPITVLVMGGVTALGVWSVDTSTHPPLIDLLPLAGVGLGVMALVTLAAVTAFSNRGIVVAGEGILVYEALLWGRVFQRPVRWSELREPKVGSSFDDLLVRTDGPPVVLSPSQARAVFSDPRCPQRGALDPALAARIGLDASPAK